jgi:hypothetical protein
VGSIVGLAILALVVIGAGRVVPSWFPKLLLVVADAEES